tara:strand:- start:19076 stop:20443 length:1368 start_codon:yes stop_codon:yes gene_type:complete
MNNRIFREYDIRGIVEEDFQDKVVIDLGRAYGKYLLDNNQNKISISGDIRYSTSKLKSNLINGLIESGIDVYDLGILPTPVNYFSLFHTDIKNSIQITGSHNPKEYNGFKISFKGKPFFGSDIRKIQAMMNKGSFQSNRKAKGSIRKLDVLDDYINIIKNDINLESDISCIMDCGNSVGGLVAPTIFKELGINLKEIYCDINPDFPNHHPDPTVDENLNDLVKYIRMGDYDLGIAYDGDADRVVAVDEKGFIIRPDILMSLFIPFVISENDAVIFDVKCSRSLEETILKYGGNPVMYKTGHSLIKNKMIDMKSKFGGEMSGHIFFNDRYYGYDDGIYVSLRLIELLSKSTKKISDYIAEIPKYISTPEIRIDCDDDIKFEVVNNIKKYFLDNFKCILIDGIRIEFDYGWGLVRASNTQPVIVCRFESDTLENLNKIKSIVFNQIELYGINIDNGL